MKQSVFKNACEMYSEWLQFRTKIAVLSHGREIPITASVGRTEEQFGTHWFPISL